ncbi:MAG: DUF362 domain-containing protein [Verrucomicrobia bacterium]|nr:DUF362 domain-containing protein [Verrucomicrobiota bacterium]
MSLTLARCLILNEAMTRCFTAASARLKELILEQLAAWGGGLAPRRIVIKPNWVMHETDPVFPIAALVTDARVIEATLEACLALYPRAESILVGDCPLQSADWPLLCRQSGLDAVIQRFSGEHKIVFRDLRKHAFKADDSSFLIESTDEHGDPCGYREVELGTASHLEPISHQARKFAVNDYSASVTRSNHCPGSHRYFVGQSFLDADLFINLPKWKSHQKSGLTAALKNLVGINSDKAYLPHFRRGAPKWGGDEYRDENRWLYWAQTNLRENIQKRSQLAFRLLKPGWEMIKRMRGIETRMTTTATVPKKFYIAGGAWPGNDTIWRMIYDLNLVVQCADAHGQIHSMPQRNYFTIVDGLTSGEGNGPLQPLPRETDWLVCGEDPFAIDAVLGWFMGCDLEKLPIIAQRANYAGSDWGDFDLNELPTEIDGQAVRLLDSPINFHFAPPPGWRNYIER